MIKVTLENYKEDKYYPKKVEVVDLILESKRFVAPVDVFESLGLLADSDKSKWKNGGIPYLGRAVECNLSKANRILRILRFHAHNLNLRPSATEYKGKNGKLQFSKTGDKKLEEAYSRHFVVVGKKR